VEKYHNPLVAEERLTKTSKIFLSCQFPSLITVKRKLVGILMQKLNTVVIKKYNKNLINWLNMLIQYDGGYNGHR
jgi:hypothetical protein